MLQKIFIGCFFVFSLLFSQNLTAQTLKFEELVATFSAKDYPAVFYDTLETKGFFRIDKLYPEGCVRVMYALEKSGKAVEFASTHICLDPFRNSYFPVTAKHQLELQYQKRARSQFDLLHAAIRKKCKPLPANQQKTDKAASTVKPKVKAYQHPESGIRFVVCDFVPVSYIFLVK